MNKVVCKPSISPTSVFYDLSTLQDVLLHHAFAVNPILFSLERVDALRVRRNRD